MTKKPLPHDEIEITNFTYNIDAVEQSPEYLAIADEIETEIHNQFADGELFLGRCHEIWTFKKKLLKEKYGIDWHSPAELNPFIIFD